MQEIRQKNLKEGWKKIEEVLHWEDLLYIPEIIKTKLFSKHHDNLLVGHFRVKKTKELVIPKYYWQTLQADIENYIKECDICITFKAIKLKLYGDLQLLLILINC